MKIEDYKLERIIEVSVCELLFEVEQIGIPGEVYVDPEEVQEMARELLAFREMQKVLREILEKVK